MIAIPAVVVVCQMAWGPVQDGVKAFVVQAKNNAVVKELMDEAARMGLVRSKVLGKWWLQDGVLTKYGAQRMGEEGGAGRRAMMGSQTVYGGWVLGLVKVEGKAVRAYVQGPKLLETGKVVGYQFSKDGGPWFGGQGRVREDGTIHVNRDFSGASELRLRFGPRSVAFDVRGYALFEKLLDKLKGFEMPEEREPLRPLPPLSLR